MTKDMEKKDLEKKLAKLDAMDLMLLKWSAAVVILMLVKIIPQILNIGWLPMIIVLVVLAAKPAYDFFM